MLQITNSRKPDALCEFCLLTTIIPSLDDQKNLARWRRLEAAKRQLHSQLRSLGLPPYAYASSIQSMPSLSYEFVTKKGTSANGAPIMMGHEQGKITILIEEADGSYRERIRERLNEPQRTLIGHFRHEIGHYIDLLGIPSNRRNEYVNLFGDPLAMDYEKAKTNYYEQHKDSHWSEHYISRYASMHPWEDFAETVDCFLDLAALLQVACDHEIMKISNPLQLVEKEMLRRYREIALLSNELNFSRGLDMLVPEIISEPVRNKLAFVASLCIQS